MKHHVGSIAYAVILLFAGCVQAVEYDTGKKDAGNYYTYETAHYTVRTNIGAGEAQHIGELMEKALGEYRRLTGYYAGKMPRFIINAYATTDEYETVAKKQGFPGDTTNGLYTPAPPAAIHVAYVTDEGSFPDAILLHEGIHQFIDQAMSFSVPASTRESLPAPQQKRTAVPLWLNEGLATYMEGAITDGGRFEAGRVNGPRLRHLKRLIRTDDCPPLREVLSRRYGDPFSVADYAVAWGIVYMLVREVGPDGKPSGLDKLQRYLEACRQALRVGSAEDPVVLFQRIVAGEGQSLKDWERVWARKIEKLK